VKHTTIKGRTDDMVIIRGTNIYPGQIESVLMKNESIGGNWRMILTTDKNETDQLTIEVESKNILSQVDQMDLEQRLTSEIKSAIVFSPKVTVLPPNGIIQEGLKAKRVIDQRKKE
jgi:phenylacetate-CoA ligase